jgi:hypothetical protein
VEVERAEQIDEPAGGEVERDAQLVEPKRPAASILADAQQRAEREDRNCDSGPGAAQDKIESGASTCAWWDMHDPVGPLGKAEKLGWYPRKVT